MLFQINRFHFCVLITWQFTIFFASQQLFGIFANYEPKWSCNGGEPTDNCTVYTECDPAQLKIEEIEFESLSLEYNWRCTPEGDAHKKYFSKLQFLGVLIGTITSGMLSDRFGRKPIAIAVLTLGVTSLSLSALFNSVYVILGMRVFVGLAIGGSLVVVCTFVMEMLLPQQRMALRAFFNWGVARGMVTAVCWKTLNWRPATLVCAALSAPAILILVFLFPESPTWLHSKGRLEEMRESEKAIARRGGVEYVPVAHRKIEKNKTFIELIRGGLLKRLIVLWIMWFSASLCGYAIDLNSNTISGDLYVNQFFLSLLIAVSKMVLVLVDTYVPNFSRRVLHQGSQAAAVALFAVAAVMAHKEYQGVGFLLIYTLGTVFIEYTWDACYLCAVESMETSSRASAGGSCSFVARLGAILAPELAALNKHYASTLYIVAVIVGTINFVQSYLFLVETKGIVLDNVKVDVDSVEEGGALATEEEMAELASGKKPLAPHGNS